MAEALVSQPDVRDDVGRAVGVIQESTATAVEHNNLCPGEWRGGEQVRRGNEFGLSLRCLGNL